MQTTTLNKTTSIFANKSDLIAAEKRIKELEAENRALKAGTASTAPATASATSKPLATKGLLYGEYKSLQKSNPAAAHAFWEKNKTAIFEGK